MGTPYGTYEGGKNACNDLVGKPEGKRLFSKLGVDGIITLI
jgi:hypothetical protein